MGRCLHVNLRSRFQKGPSTEVCYEVASFVGVAGLRENAKHFPEGRHLFSVYGKKTRREVLVDQHLVNNIAKQCFDEVLCSPRPTGLVIVG